MSRGKPEPPPPCVTATYQFGDGTEMVLTVGDDAVPVMDALFATVGGKRVEKEEDTRER